MRAQAAALGVQQEHLRRQQALFGERIASAKEQVRRGVPSFPCRMLPPPHFWCMSFQLDLSRSSTFGLAVKGIAAKHAWWPSQWKHKKAAAQSMVVEQQRCKEAIEADNAANQALLAENHAKARLLLPFGG